MSSEMIETQSATRFAAKNYNEFENVKKNSAKKARIHSDRNEMMRNENNNNSTSATLCLHRENGEHDQSRTVIRLNKT